MDFESKTCEFELAYISFVIFGMNHGFMMFDDHFDSIQGVMDVIMIWPYAGISMIMDKLSRFLNQICLFGSN